MKIHNVTQGEVEWFRLRMGRPTASEFDRILKPSTLEVRAPSELRKYVYEKAAESWLGHALPKGGGHATEQGHMLEDEARNWYSWEYEANLRNVGFVESEDGLCGCSPDALGEDFGVELKNPYAQTHVGYLCGGVVPLDYVCQVQGSLYVTGLPEWRFVSYRRGFPGLVVVVKREDENMAKIAAGVAAFHKEYAHVMERLKEVKENQ